LEEKYIIHGAIVLLLLLLLLLRIIRRADLDINCASVPADGKKSERALSLSLALPNLMTPPERDSSLSLSLFSLVFTSVCLCVQKKIFIFFFGFDYILNDADLSFPQHYGGPAS
jgi:hypothetical protein